MIRKTITLTGPPDRRIGAQVSPDHCTTDREYIRDLIRSDRHRHAETETLRVAIQEGLDSSPSDETVCSIMQDVEARLRRDGPF